MKKLTLNEIMSKKVGDKIRVIEKSRCPFSMIQQIEGKIFECIENTDKIIRFKTNETWKTYFLNILDKGGFHFDKPIIKKQMEDSGIQEPTTFYPEVQNYIPTECYAVELSEKDYI